MESADLQTWLAAPEPDGIGRTATVEPGPDADTERVTIRIADGAAGHGLFFRVRLTR